MSLDAKLSWPGIIKLARESLVSDIPAGEGKTANLFKVYLRTTVLLVFILSLKSPSSSSHSLLPPYYISCPVPPFTPSHPIPNTKRP
jgi:hypothetical protein